MAKKKKQQTKYLCNACGYETYKWIGKCPNCNVYNSLVEITETGSEYNVNYKEGASTVNLTEVKTEISDRITSGIIEFDRLVGNGLVESSILLIGGSPGIGKSTLMLQLLNGINKKSIYVTGEESPKQIKHRAERLNINSKNINLLPNININEILKKCDELKPEILVADSVQTIYDPEIDSPPGYINQIKYVTLKLMEYAKKKNIIVFVIGHITKKGDFAGPRVLEHIVDTVLYFEGEKNNDYRILKSIKNRFGSTNEIAVFEMTEKGLTGVENYTNLFFYNRNEKVSGIANSVIIEGSRALLIEIQALTTDSVYGNSRRIINGYDYKKLSVIIAIIEKHCGISLIDKDIFVNVTGGLEIDEPVIDLAVAVAILSSFKNRSIDFKSIFIGELGLTGEVRSVSRVNDRIRECIKNKINVCVLSEQNKINNKTDDKVKLHYINNIKDILKYF